MWRPSQYRRFLLVNLLLTAGFVALLLRAHHVMVRRQAELTAKARALTDSQETLPPWRGDLVARDGTVLATTLPTKTVYVDIRLCDDRLDAMIAAVARLVGANPREVRTQIQRGLLAAGRRRPNAAPDGAVVVRRQVTSPEWQLITNALASETFGREVRSLNRKDLARLRELRRHLLFAEDDQQRVHPHGQLACHVLGYTTSSVQGLLLRGAAGIEQTMDAILAGTPGWRWSERDAAGRELPYRRRVLQTPRDGGRIVLTLDWRVQALAETVLADVARRSNPSNAAILVVRPSTGEILAWACWPSFRPDSPGESPPEHWLNRPIWAPFEPGSTFKTFTLAAALDEGITTLDQPIDCARGRLVWNRQTFTDRGLSFGLVPVREAFARSLNTAHVQLALRLGRERFWQHLTNFGFGEATGIALPGEGTGGIGALTNRAQAAHAFAAFGQGIAVTQLQLTMAFCAVVNGGVLMKPLLVGRIHHASGRVIWHARPTAVRRVLRPETSVSMREALLHAVASTGATGRQAATLDYLCGGKTGTAEKAGTHGRGYLPGRYVASFIGAIPIHDPALVVSVVIDEPQGAHGGGSAAAPVFAEVAGGSARLLGVAPDAPAVLTSARR